MPRQHFLSICFILLFISVALSTPSVAHITFEKAYGGADDDVGSCVIQTSDNGYLVTGSTMSFGLASQDVYLVKTDSMGNVLWDSTYGDSFSDFGSSVCETPDHGYVIAGWTASVSADSLDVLVMKTDSLGKVLWTTACGGPDWDGGYSVVQTDDSGYVVCGTTHSFGSGTYDVYLLKVDSLGNLLWDSTFGGGNIDYGRSVQQTLDGGFIIAGATASFGLGWYDVYLIKTDRRGAVTWESTFGDSEYDWGNCVRQTTDKGYIIAGYSSSFGPSSKYDIYLVKTDSLGVLMWDTTYGEVTSNERASSVEQTQDGGYIVAGWIEPAGGLPDKCYMVKTDSLGNVIWTRTFGGSGRDRGQCVHQTMDGGYCIAGWTESFGAGMTDVYLIKTDENGIGVQEQASSVQGFKGSRIELVQNRPNPVRESTTISYILPEADRVKLQVFDAAGRLVETLVDETQGEGTYQVRWDAGGASSGIYFYRLTSQSFADTKKLTVVH
jgi:hypothetical protein